MNESTNENGLLSPPPSTPTGDTPVRSRTPPSWVAATSVPSIIGSTTTPLLTRLSPLPQRQHRIVSPLPDSGRRMRSSNPRERLILNYEAMAHRPRSRSNSFNRTPRRYESPVSTTPNRVSIRLEDQEDAQAAQAQAQAQARSANIRLGTGMAVGTLSGRITEEHLRERSNHRASTKSVKQKPSHRKLHRWNNDRLVGIATDIAKTHRDPLKGEALAKAFLEGQAESHLYMRPNYPLDYRSVFAKLVVDDSEKARIVKERFIKGEVASSHNTKSILAAKHKSFLSHDTTIIEKRAIMYAQINARLRNILEKTYSSNPHTMAMELIRNFELHLNSVLGKGETTNDWVILSSSTGNSDSTSNTSNVPPKQYNHIDNPFKVIQRALIKPPTIQTSSKTGKKNIQYFFDADSSTAAYHRLLLHAVCKFHGLTSFSSNVSDIDDNSKEKKHARVLTVSGIFQGCNLCLIDHLEFITTTKEIAEKNMVPQKEKTKEYIIT